MSLPLLTPQWCGVGGEGREKRLADIDRYEKQAAELVQQATAVPLGMVTTQLTSLHTLLH